MMLSVNELKFLYRNRTVLQEIGFSINAGEVVAVLGPNGVGKTTLLKCMNRILRPKEGSVYLDEEDLMHLETKEIARRVGYVPQRIETGRLTTFDAVLLGRTPHIGWDVQQKDLEIADSVLKKLHMDSLRLSYIDEMSGGELQKVAIARALVQEPKVLLLDEPTSNLDLKNQVEILTIIRDIARDHRIAVVMTMHDLNQALRFADSFIFLKDGTVRVHGGNEIVTADIIEEVYGLPVMIGELGGVRWVIPGCCHVT
jgi:iron complex transport system ATP-binding protein